MKRLAQLIIFVAMHLLAMSGVRAQNGEFSRIRNPQFVGARPMAMGEAFLALADDINTLYWNPAGMPFVERYEFQFMYANLFQSGLTDKYAATLAPSLPFFHSPENLAFGLGWQNLSLGDDELDFSQNKFALSLGYEVGRFFSLGVNIKLLTSNITLDNVREGNAMGWGFDAGALFWPTQSLSLGVMVQDLTNTKLGGQTHFLRNMRFGAAYRFRDFLTFQNPALVLDVDDRMHLGAEIWLLELLALRAGWQKDLYESSEDKGTLSFGLGLKWKFVRLDYAYTDSPFLQNTQRFAVNISLSPRDSPVRIDDPRESIHLNDIFVSQHPHHARYPWAVINAEYQGDKPVKGTLIILVDKYGIKEQREFKIDPKLPVTKQIEVKLILPDHLLSLPANVREPVRARVIIKTHAVVATRPLLIEDLELSLYGKNNIDWGTPDIVAPAAAFVMPEDPAVRQVAEAVNGLFMQPRELLINENITKASLAFHLLRQHGINYTLDPHLPQLDVIQYPQELLRSKRGDCDDLSVLFASVLESMGINTALVGLPRHLMIMFDSGMRERHQLQMCTAPQQYIIRDNHVWLPLETTWLDKSFLAAWQQGASQYQQYKTHDEFSIAETREAWNKYPYPKNMDDPPPRIQPSETETIKAWQKDREKYLTERDSYLQTNFAEPLNKAPNDLATRLRYARTLNLLGRSSEAESLLALP